MLFQNFILASIAALAIVQPTFAAIPTNVPPSPAAAPAGATPQPKGPGGNKQTPPKRIRFRGFVYKRVHKVKNPGMKPDGKKPSDKPKAK